MEQTSLGDPDTLTLTVDEVARLLGLSRGLTYQAVKDGSIPSIRIGRRILIPRSGLLELLGARSANNAD